MVVRTQTPERGTFEADGFSILLDVFGRKEIDTLLNALSNIEGLMGVRTRAGVYAARNLLLHSPVIHDIARSEKLLSIVETTLSRPAFPVRGTLFDKTAGANWLVPWHQDLTVCVSARITTPGWGPWTVKAGVCHVQPPVSILENMLSVRIHLDDCNQLNGPLSVLPGTHEFGRLTSTQIVEQQRSKCPVSCTGNAGCVVLMRPLLLHASSAAAHASHRRVIHIDYASSPLEGGLKWLTDASETRQ